MLDERPVTPEPPAVDNGGWHGNDLTALRRILVGPEQRRIDAVEEKLRTRQLTAEEVAERLPEAIALRSQQDRQIGRALAPTVEIALRESIRRHPREIATAIFPVLGPAIRKAIAETMASLVRSINSAVEHSFTPRGIRWRIESWRTGIPYAQVVISHALVYRVEQAFLIHAETGLLLAHATAQDLKVPDADIISSMMTAIQDFVRDSFRPGEGATLRTFSVGEHTVTVEQGPQALLALVIRGQSPDAVLRRQQDILETIHIQFNAPLIEFSGETSAFASAIPLLEECLETVVDHGTAGARRARTLSWVAPVVTLALVGIVLAGRGAARFNRAVAALDAEPGIVVVNAERSWGTWRISGVRDPVARTPAAVVAGIGLPTRNLSGHWEGYVSLDSAIVVSRAKRVASLTDATSLAVRGDTLAVTGPVPLPSLAILSRPGMVAGVSALSLAGAQVTLPPALDSLRTSIEGDRVLFAPGSADIDGVGIQRVRSVAAQFRRLDDAAAGMGGEVSVVVVGRTDVTGTDETNQSLARERADRVAALLQSGGVRTSGVRVEALASSNPLTSPDAVEQARINRSTSFVIVISPRNP